MGTFLIQLPRRTLDQSGDLWLQMMRAPEIGLLCCAAWDGLM
jgi:hypothetical protein